VVVMGRPGFFDSERWVQVAALPERRFRNILLLLMRAPDYDAVNVKLQWFLVGSIGS
jgi:hypothetical protein